MIINPNQLKEHEGHLLQVIRDVDGYVVTEQNNEYNFPTQQSFLLKRKDICMFLECYNDVNGYNWIKILHKEKIVKVFVSPSSWMM